MRNFLKNTKNAWRFLTIVPLPGGRPVEPAELGASVVCFPVVGLLIGLAAAGAARLLPVLLPGPLVAVSLVFLLLAVSGGLHMDGVADTGDGFLSSRSREKILTIMRDSRVGSMGVLTIAFTLLFKGAALAVTTSAQLPATVFLMPVAGRTAIVLAMAMLPYARPEGGLGALFYPPRPRRTAWGAVLFASLCAFLAGGVVGVLALAIALTSTALFAVWCRKKIGGGTGDTFGAACELAETVFAVALVAPPVAQFAAIGTMFFKH